MSRQKLGQHFLINAPILDRIAAAVCEGGASLIIEIGPGPGALTRRLLPCAERLVAIELDRELARSLSEEFVSEPRLSVIQGDALETDFARWGPAVIAGNLPYYVATPLIERVLERPASVRRAVFLIQKEVAERMSARQGTRAYGYLSILVQFRADVELLFTVRPSAFRPPPKVDSALVRIHPRDRTGELRVGDTGEFLRFVARCFRHKRKTLRNNLGKQIDGWPEASRRAEQLSLEQFAELYRRLVP